MTSPPFHLAFPVRDLAETREFYTTVLGCRVGRESDRWLDFDFAGHQISAQLAPDDCAPVATNAVDGQAVPSRHFGLVLPWEEWRQLSQRLQDAGTTFLIEPTLRFEGRTGEQATLFIRDPSGNALEFKSFKNPGELFAREEPKS
jgi:extradiol dioxygenase family protein